MAKPANYFNDSKIAVITQWCKGCGICTLLCKNNVLTLDSRKKAVVANPAACTACGHCENHCPDIAIRVSRPVAKENVKIPAVAPL